MNYTYKDVTYKIYTRDIFGLNITFVSEKSFVYMHFEIGKCADSMKFVNLLFSYQRKL